MSYQIKTIKNMNRKIRFEVTLAMSENISEDEQLLEIAENIAKAIRTRANETSIAPEQSDAYTIMVEVKPQFVDNHVTLKI